MYRRFYQDCATFVLIIAGSAIRVAGEARKFSGFFEHDSNTAVPLPVRPFYFNELSRFLTIARVNINEATSWRYIGGRPIPLSPIPENFSWKMFRLYTRLWCTDISIQRTIVSFKIIVFIVEQQSSNYLFFLETAQVTSFNWFLKAILIRCFERYSFYKHLQRWME